MGIVFFIIGFILIVISIFILSWVSVDVERLYLTNFSGKLENDYTIYLKLYFLNKIKVLSIKIDKERLEKFHIKDKIENIDFKQVEQDMPNFKEIKSLISKLKIETKKFKSKLEIGTEDVIITSAIVTIISATLGILLGITIKNYKKQNYKYIIKPLYQNKNIIKLNLNCIIKVKMVHIIYTIYVLVKKRRVNKNERRTSNRRAYDYSYE